MEPNRVHPVAPTAEHPDQEAQFLDLTSACHNFAANISQMVPRLRNRWLSADQRAVVYANIARTKATLDLLETALDTCETDMEEALMHILQNK